MLFRSTTRSLGALAITSGVTLVADRTMIASASASNSSVNPPSTTLTTQRVYDFIPGTNLAKAEEQQTLVKEMRQELINRILLQSMSHTNTLTVPAQGTQSTSAHTSSSHGTH